MNRPTSLALVAVTCAALAACSTSKPAPTAAPVATPAAATSTQPTIAPSAIASMMATPAALALGKSSTISNDEGASATVTVYAFKQPVATGAPKPDQAGYVWAAIDVKVCSNLKVYVSNAPWSLVYADDSSATPSSVGYNQFPEPGYPFGDKILNAGRCIRGWITFPAPKTARPTMVEYELDDGNMLDWKA